MDSSELFQIWEIVLTILIPIMGLVVVSFKQSINDNKNSISGLSDKLDVLKDEVHKEYVHCESLYKLENTLSEQISKLDKNVNKNFDMLHAMIKGHDENIKLLMRSKS
jgi:hypothetical protein